MLFIQYDVLYFIRVGFAAEQIAKWINDRAEINVKIFFG